MMSKTTRRIHCAIAIFDNTNTRPPTTHGLLADVGKGKGKSIRPGA